MHYADTPTGALIRCTQPIENIIYRKYLSPVQAACACETHDARKQHSWVVALVGNRASAHCLN